MISTKIKETRTKLLPSKEFKNYFDQLLFMRLELIFLIFFFIIILWYNHMWKKKKKKQSLYFQRDEDVGLTSEWSNLTNSLEEDSVLIKSVNKKRQKDADVTDVDQNEKTSKMFSQILKKSYSLFISCHIYMNNVFDTRFARFLIVFALHYSLSGSCHVNFFSFSLYIYIYI